jgi:branched-chain amino acid transport system substrate-binding protein
MAASTVAEKHNFPMVSSGASASEIWERGYKNTFGLYTLAELYMDEIIELGKTKGLRKIALIYENTAFPRAVASGVKTKAKQFGMQVVFEEEYGKASTDFTAMIIKIKSKKPDIVIGGSYLPDSVAFMRQAKENRLYAKIFAFAVGPGLPDFGQNLGLDAEGVMGNTQWEPTLKLPGAKEFAEKYKTRYGHEPGYHAGGGYGAGYVLEAAVKKAGSTDRDKVRAALSARHCQRLRPLQGGRDRQADRQAGLRRAMARRRAPYRLPPRPRPPRWLIHSRIGQALKD